MQYSQSSRPIIIVILCLFLIVGAVSTAIFISLDKPDIHTAQYDILTDINGLGDVLSKRVINYIEYNPECVIDDLVDVKGIGVKKLELIKKHYK